MTPCYSESFLFDLTKGNWKISSLFCFSKFKDYNYDNGEYLISKQDHVQRRGNGHQSGRCRSVHRKIQKSDRNYGHPQKGNISLQTPKIFFHYYSAYVPYFTDLYSQFCHELIHTVINNIKWSIEVLLANLKSKTAIQKVIISFKTFFSSASSQRHGHL